jgi:transposase
MNVAPTSMIADRRSALASVPQISVDEIDFDGVRQTLSGAFQLLRDRIPFIPANQDERDLIAALHQGVSRIQMSQQAGPPRSYRLTITMQWERYFLSPEEVEACGFDPEIIETQFLLPHAYTRNTGSIDRDLSDLAAAGLHALTDAQWSLVERDLPDLKFTESHGARAATDTRSIVHCLLFITRMDVPLTTPPQFFGQRKAVYNALLRLIWAGGIETLVGKLAKADPAWLEGLDFDRFRRIKRSSRITTQPTLAAARYAEEGRYDLTDVPWSAIRHLFGHKLAKPTGKRPSPIEMRTAVDGILVKLRSGCNWKKMPDRFGGGSELRNVAFRICHQGVWTNAYDILKRDFPEVVAGLSTEALGYMTRKPRRSYESVSRPASSRQPPH